MSDQQKYYIALKVALDALGIHYLSYGINSVTLHDLRNHKSPSVHTERLDIFMPDEVDPNYAILEPGAAHSKSYGNLIDIVDFLKQCKDLCNQR